MSVGVMGGLSNFLSNFSYLLLALVAQGLANASQKAMLGHVRAKELDNNWEEFSVKGEGICTFGEGIWWGGLFDYSVTPGPGLAMVRV